MQSIPAIVHNFPMQVIEGANTAQVRDVGFSIVVRCGGVVSRSIACSAILGSTGRLEGKENNWVRQLVWIGGHTCD